MRIVKNPDERKQEILNAAIRVFTRKGYEKTSITDIAKEINVSQGLCYRYFPSKEAMYDAAIDEYASYIASHNISKVNVDGKTLKEQILLISGNMKVYCEAEHEQDDMYKFFHKEGNHKLHDQLFIKVAERLVPYIVGVLEAAKQRNEIKISDTYTVANFFVYGQMGILMDKNIPEEDKMPRIKKCLIELLGLS